MTPLALGVLRREGGRLPQRSCPYSVNVGHVHNILMAQSRTHTALRRDGAHDEAGYSVRGAAGGMADAVMDITGEDAKEMAAGHRRFHWDKRHKRYVQLQTDEKLRSTGKRKTESGATVRASPRACSNDLEPFCKTSS